MVALKRFKPSDEDVEYATRITTSDCEKIRGVLADGHAYLRLTVYAEHPWSSRAKTFIKDYSKSDRIKPGDFPIGPELHVVPESS
jgi:hypothetical protein